MKKMITLPDLDAIRHFVKASEEMDDIVLVSKEGYSFQFDGASIISMMTLMGAKILVECASASDKFAKILNTYEV